jgi:hypothetical protein
MTPIIVALVGLGAALVSALLTLYGQSRVAGAQARREAEEMLTRYREPLLGAAFELQSRLYNIVRQNFLRKYLLNGTEPQRAYATTHTLYLIGQYLAWTEILRRRIQYLNFGEVAETREVSRLQEEVRAAFASDEPDLKTPLMLFRGEQRVVGELMTTSEDGELACVGYAAFRKAGSELWEWLERLESDLAAVAEAPNPRLRLLQNRLVDLIERLDKDRQRFPQQLERA